MFCASEYITVHYFIFIKLHFVFICHKNLKLFLFLAINST